MKYFFTTLFFTLLFFETNAQEVSNVKVDSSFNYNLSKRRDNFYLELLGRANYYSYNYEYEKITPFKKTYSRAIQVGIGYPIGLEKAKLKNIPLFIPISYNWIFGRKSSKLELGIGICSTIDFTPFPRDYYARMDVYKHPDKYIALGYDNTFSPVIRFVFCPSIGYRLLAKNNVLFRATFSPLATYYIFPGFVSLLPWVGISLGYSFKEKTK
jgi:hypothetical protein